MTADRSPLDQPLACVDLETTGLGAGWDRITEIGVVTLTDGVLEEWSSLVDPGCRVPPAVEALTGITSEMLRGAPTFAALADELAARLEGRLFVAHNARFDLGFLKAEFARAGRRFAPRAVCTARLSRRLFPAHGRHSLDALIGRFGLACAARHRALGDARVLVDVLAALRAAVPAAALDAALAHQLARPSLPAGLEQAAIEALPEAPGVYVFHGADDAPLYVGMSINVRSRVRSHFGADLRESKEWRLSREVRRIAVEPAAGELGALLKESRLVKTLAPLHNRRLRRHDALHVIRWRPASAEAPCIAPLGVDEPPDADDVFGVYRGKRKAQAALRELVDEAGLCAKTLGLESGPGPCFARQLGRCRGACDGAEPAARHALRLHAALAKLRLMRWPYPRPRVGFRERSADGLVEEIHVIDRWRHVGSAADAEALAALWHAAPPAFDLDVYRILARHLERGRAEVVAPP